MSAVRCRASRGSWSRKAKLVRHGPAFLGATRSVPASSVSFLCLISSGFSGPEDGSHPALLESGPTASGTLVLRGDGEVSTNSSRRDGERNDDVEGCQEPSDGRFLAFSERSRPFVSKL
jgi:hypothetical protein